MPQGVINFDHFMCILKSELKDPLCFSLNFYGLPDRTFNFKCLNQNEAHGWKMELQRHIDHSEGYKS